MEIILSWLQYVKRLNSCDGSQFAIEKVPYIGYLFNFIQSEFFVCLGGIFVCLFGFFVFCFLFFVYLFISINTGWSIIRNQTFAPSNYIVWCVMYLW